MKIPPRNTCAHAICKLIYTTGPRTKGQLVGDLAKRFQRNTVEGKVDDLSSSKLIRPSDEGFHLDARMLRHFDQCEADLRPARPIAKPPAATPRVAPAFRPLSNYRLPLDGTRDGAGDFRQIPSRHMP